MIGVIYCTLLSGTTFHVTNKHSHVYCKSSSASVLVLLTSAKTIKIVFDTAEIKYTVKNLKRILEKFYLGIYLKQQLYM